MSALGLLRRHHELGLYEILSVTAGSWWFLLWQGQGQEQTEAHLQGHRHVSRSGTHCEV